MKVLVIDIGGTNVKILASGQTQPRKFPSGPSMTPANMLNGFHQMDEHFRTASFECDLPVLMGLLAIWHNNFFGAQTIAVLPYEQNLKRFPAYLQQ